MAHLGRNLLPTWLILRPSWDHLRPNFAKNLGQIAPEVSSSAPRHPKTTQRVAKELQDSPGAQIFMVLGSILDLFFQVFPSVSPSILHGLLASSSARWRLGARSALDIRRPRVAGGRACVNLVSSSSNFTFPTLFKGPRGLCGPSPTTRQPTIATIPHSPFRLKLAILAHLRPS